MRNEYGEEISITQTKRITARVLKLPDALIDEFFYKCKLIYSRRDYTFRALHHLLLLDLKKNRESSEIMITLFSEHKISDVLKALEKVEEEYNKFWKF